MKLEELQTIATDENLDIIFISETWFDVFDVPTLIGFKNYRNDRKEHGGEFVFTFVMI